MQNKGRPRTVQRYTHTHVYVIGGKYQYSTNEKTGEILYADLDSYILVVNARTDNPGIAIGKSIFVTTEKPEKTCNDMSEKNQTRHQFEDSYKELPVGGNCG